MATRSARHSHGGSGPSRTLQTRLIVAGVTALIIIAWSYNSVSMLGGGGPTHTNQVQELQNDHQSQPPVIAATTAATGGGGALRVPTHAVDKRVAANTDEEEEEEEDGGGGVAAMRDVRVTPSRETWPMMDYFYTSLNEKEEEETSTTIIFNLFKGPAQALQLQLEAATSQQKIVPPEIWVMCFDSPLRDEYEKVVNSFKSNANIQSKIVFTVSDFNHKFHGRFLLAYMAKTKYVLIIDDDKNIDSTTVYDYITHMKMQKGVWGNFGHLRAPTFDGYKSWPSVGFDLQKHDYAEMDYLSGMWFLEQNWLEYFVKERMPSWETSEDMHLSHVMRKYLNLNTYGGKVALSTKGLPSKPYAATVGKALDLREYIFDHQLGRGNKVANVDQPIDTLVYAETVGDIESFLAKIESCSQEKDAEKDELSESEEEAEQPWCLAGKTAVVFRGAKEQDIMGMIDAAKRLCAKTQCEYLSLKPKIKHPIHYFNMREGYGQAQDTQIPWQTSASDVLLSFVGILNNVLPKRIFLPDVTNVRWMEEEDTNNKPVKQNRLQIYHDTIRLAITIHVNSPSNQKWQHRDREMDHATAYPADVQVYTYSTTANPAAAGAGP